MAGSWEDGPTPLEVRRPYDGGDAGATWYASDEQVERAVAAAHAVRDDALALPLHARAETLARAAARIAERVDELASVITAESGKPATWARAEVGRAVSVFR